MKTEVLLQSAIKLFIAFIIIVLPLQTMAQVTVMPDCLGNPPAGNTCETATPICDLNGYCGTTSLGVYTADYWGSAIGCGFLGLFPCPGIGGEFCGSIENNSFLTIVADAPTISFNVWVFNSTFGDGIQLALYDIPTCGTGNVDQLYCNGQMLPTGTNNYHNIVINNLIPGNTYYIMIDGFAGDECDYVIGAEEGISVPVSVSPSETTICTGETVDLTASGGDGSYTWDASPDLSTTTGENVTVTPPGIGTYTYTVNSNSGNPNCPSSVTATATVIVEGCICTVTAQNTGPVCVGEEIDLTATDVVDATYEWSGPDGFSANVQNGIGVTPPTTPGDYTYTVEATTAAGTCQSETTVTVLAAPPVNAGLDQTICEGDSVTLTADNPVGAAISWSDNVVNGDAFAPESTQTYTVTATLDGCSSTDEVEVVVIPTPQVDAGTYGPFCDVDPIQQLIGSPTGGVFTINGNNVTTFDPSGGSQEVIYTYSDINGCGSADTIFIVVDETPIAGFTATPLTGTPPLDVTITNETSGQTTGYSWIFGNGDSSTDGFQNYTTTYAESGIYEIVLLVTNNGCSNVASITVVVSNPEPSFNIPNVFTPNEDGSNDYFHFSLVNVAKFELTVLNRWGNVMFETDDVNTKGWDGNSKSGKPATEGTYFHKYIITDLEGNEISGHGFLHLVRD